MRNIKTETLSRPHVDFLDHRLGWEYPVLDKGFIRVVDYMGDDAAIDNAARMSYGEGTKRTSEAAGLIRYLMKHGHTSPFEMCELKLHVKLPIFVMRQWVRHRTASLNEYSARYSVMREEFYLPSMDDLMEQSKDNKQGRDGLLPKDLGKMVQNAMADENHRSYHLYEHLLSEEYNLSRELARINLPVSIYTEMVWKVNLHNLFHFLQLRNDSHAQKEIREYAQVIEDLVSGWVPLAWNAYRTYRADAITFSGSEAPLVRVALSTHDMLNDHDKPVYAEALSMREWRDFIRKIKRMV